MLLAVFAVAAAHAVPDKETHWAVLVAGSNGWWNYRHQSDTCHTYQILRKNGIPASRIIHLAYDDIANNSANPFPGQVFNKPSPTEPGFDVYKDCAIDYKGEDVTPTNFINILKGDKEGNKGKGNGRVLETTKDDKIFIYYTDHGATGLVAFPSGELYATDLIATLKYMHDNEKYKRLVFYLEACESGSMFDKILPADWEIYATTASNPEESSWATYCSPDDVVDGKSVGSCLGDEYSVAWMEDTEAAERGKHLQKQFEDVRDRTKGSHVQQYGVLGWTDESLHNYQGDEQTEYGKMFWKHNRGKFNKNKKYLKKARKSVVDSRDTKLHYLLDRLKKQHNSANENALTEELLYRKTVDTFFQKFNLEFNVTVYDYTVNCFKCLKTNVEALKTCKNLWGEYTLKYVKALNTACGTADAEAIRAHILASC